MYEMLTGKVPFDADTPVSVALKHMQEIPKEPILINPAIPTAINKIIMKAMKKDPNQRYQSATEMLRDLTMALKNPDGNFVNIDTNDGEFPTQVIPTLQNKNIEEKIKEKEASKKKKNFFQKHKTLTVVLILIMLFALSLGGTILVFNLTRSKDVQVPNFVGKTVEQIEGEIKDTKLKYEIAEEKYDVEIEAGQIISQEPEYKEDYKIKENTVIKIVVSKGQKFTKVPKVSGMTIEEAREAIKEAELEIEEVEEYNDKIEKGYVIEQDVPPDEEVGAGSKVTVKVSKGEEKVVVPNVVGKTKEEATKELQDAGFVITATLTEEDSTREDGTVLKQSLNAGDSVKKGSNITITVNQIRQMVTGTATINLKSVLNYTEPTAPSDPDDNEVGGGTTSGPKSVKVKVVVGNDTVYSSSHKENETNIKTNFSGIGTVYVKLYVDDILKDTKTVNLNETTSVIFE